MCQSTNGLTIAQTGENVVVGVNVGCYCVNNNQPDGKCDYDYQVKFLCCL